MFDWPASRNTFKGPGFTETATDSNREESATCANGKRIFAERYNVGEEGIDVKDMVKQKRNPIYRWPCWGQGPKAAQLVLARKSLPMQESMLGAAL
jgi:hypothetical protein